MPFQLYEKIQMSTLKETIDAFEVEKAKNVPADKLVIMNQATVDLVSTEIHKQAYKS